MKGSTYKRKDGKWVGAVELPKYLSGKRRRKIVYGKTEKEVERKVNTIIHDLEYGEYEEPLKDTFIEFLNQYYKVCLPKWENTTASLYRMYIDVHFKPYFGNKKLKDVKPITLDEFYNYKLSNKENKKKPLTINTVIKLNVFAKSALNYAIKNNIIKYNPANNVVLSKKEKYKPTVYSEMQFTELLDNVKRTDDEIPIILGAGCGLRRGEIFGLSWKNIDFLNKTITIENTSVRFNQNIEKRPKTETSNRTIVAPDYVIETLKEYRKLNNGLDNEKIITRWKASSYSERFKNLLDKYGLEHIRLHDLRHYNAVIMLQKGISDKVAAERLGHAEVGTLRNVYQHVLKEMDEKAAQNINEMFVK